MEKTTQLCIAVVRLQPPSAPGTKQLDSTEGNDSTRHQEQNKSTQQEKTTQLVSRNETTQLSRRKQLNSLTGTKQLKSALSSTAYTAYNRLHRLYSRIGFLYLLSSAKRYFETNRKPSYKKSE
ncbi:hypothetical protein TNCV_517031 [Trichonephila clavipes]|nr:hypothetical protein TNCV_517031 [Trichonephila clavipes]